MFGSMHNVFTFALPKRLSRGIKNKQMKTTNQEIKKNNFNELYVEVVHADGSIRKIYITGSIQSDPA